jgi:hypothetical protein
MGHSKEIITMDVYGDNQGIIADGVPEIEEYMETVLPDRREKHPNDQSDVLIDLEWYLNNETRASGMD